MRMYDLILKKRQGNVLTKDEIDWMIREYTDGRIPDYQMSAMMMAICLIRKKLMSLRWQWHKVVRC